MTIDPALKGRPVNATSSPESNFNQMIDDLNVNQNAPAADHDGGHHPMSTECTVPSPPEPAKESAKRQNEVIILCPTCQGTGFKFIPMPTSLSCRCHDVHKPPRSQNFQLGLQGAGVHSSDNR